MPQLDKEARKQYNRKLYLKRKERTKPEHNITMTIEEITEEEVSKQSKHIIPDEKKYIDALRSMLIPSHKFVTLVPCDVEPRGRPIFSST